MSWSGRRPGNGRATRLQPTCPPRDRFRCWRRHGQMSRMTPAQGHLRRNLTCVDAGGGKVSSTPLDGPKIGTEYVMYRFRSGKRHVTSFRGGCLAQGAAGKRHKLICSTCDLPIPPPATKIQIGGKMAELLTFPRWRRPDIATFGANPSRCRNQSGADSRSAKRRYKGGWPKVASEFMRGRPVAGAHMPRRAPQFNAAAPPLATATAATAAAGSPPAAPPALGPRLPAAAPLPARAVGGARGRDLQQAPARGWAARGARGRAPHKLRMIDMHVCV